MGHMPHATAHPTAHTFHIPVMGTGFTIDAPLKVARFGIASVVSLVDDVLIEQMRRRVAEEHGEPFVPIEDDADDARALRITAYLDLLDSLVRRQVERLRSAPFEAGSEIERYFTLLGPSPERELFERMQAETDPAVRRQHQDRLRAMVLPGPIDVNIMTKLDRDHDRRGRAFPEHSSDALSALRGFMNSRVDGSVVLSAGMNRRLFTYMATFPAAFPDPAGRLRKRIVLKVNDYRSAMLQGKMLAKLGLHVSEFRVESGLNCGGHAFGGKGQLLGPLLDEFKREKAGLLAKLAKIRRQAPTGPGQDEPGGEPAPSRVTVQGGLGNAREDRLMLDHYGVDGTGWGSAFLFVPEVVNIDPESLTRLEAAREQDIDLSDASPLGVPFWSLRNSSSEEHRLLRIAGGKPGSACPKGYLVSNTEFTTAPICTASRGFQHRKLKQLREQGLSAREEQQAREAVMVKACICHDLAGGATGPKEIDASSTTAVCCGPNAAYFHQAASLDAMVDHIYGRSDLALDPERPHMLLKEMSLHLECLRRDAARNQEAPPSDLQARATAECHHNLQLGIRHYLELPPQLPASDRKAFGEQLESLRQELAGLASAAGLAAEISGEPQERENEPVAINSRGARPEPEPARMNGKPQTTPAVIKPVQPV